MQGALLHISSPNENRVEHGFLAKTKAEERSAGPAARVYVAQAFTDVTKEMRDGLDKIKDAVARKEESERRMKAQIAGCEKDRPGIRCDVRGYFRGGMYVLTENLEIRDVRLVYVPARSVGNYGGEIDNWAWPRHTGDFSFYRAYVAKDGKPAAYSPDNVPFQPRHFLKVSPRGVKVGDFVMVTGYPGSTSRTDTALETHHDVEWEYPYQIAYLKERYEIAKAHLGDGGDTSIKATTVKQGIQNGLEKTEGVLKGTFTMHGVSKDVTLALTFNGAATDPWGGQRVGFSATGVLNRQDFGLSYGQVMEGGGLMIGNEVEFALEVEGTLKK